MLSIRPLLLILFASILYVSALPHSTPTVSEVNDQQAHIRSIVAARQFSLAKHLARKDIKETVDLVRRTSCTDVPGPKISGKVYPKCPKSAGTGYAKYTGWTLAQDDISPYNPIWPRVPSGESCIAACNSYISTNKQICIGVVFAFSGNPRPNGTPCFLKAQGLCHGTWQRIGQEVTYLKGGCAAWQGLVPANVDAACCNN